MTCVKLADNYVTTQLELNQEMLRSDISQNTVTGVANLKFACSNDMILIFVCDVPLATAKGKKVALRLTSFLAVFWIAET